MILKKSVNVSGSTLMSESRIAKISPEDISIASHTALAFPFFVCSINLILKSAFFSFIFLATSSVLSEDFPIENIISQFSNLGILETNSSKFPLHFLLELLLILKEAFHLMIFSKNYISFYPKFKIEK